MPTENRPDQLRWRIPCNDATDDDGRVTVLVMGDRVAVVLPQGNTLVFDADEADDFARTLDRAASHTRTTD
jgi:hypothetical protein